MLWKRFSAVLLAAALLAGCSSGSKEAAKPADKPAETKTEAKIEKVTLTLSTPDPDSSSITVAAKEFAKVIGEKSKGQIEVKV
ncbi:MAG TPA: hypothetical protein VNT26_05860, partial [Candidatus Sulfotelmatobacter sp.]|nr:hypothetical protein [Candidatus Sulfotelmatobacter sp.]